MYINKTFRSALEGLFVNDPGLLKVKDLLNKNEKVVLVPIYKSFLDLALILYTLYVNDIDFPFTFGNFEDVPTVAVLDHVYTNTGYINMSRSRD